MWNPFKRKTEPQEEIKPQEETESNSFLSLDSKESVKRYDDILKQSVTQELPKIQGTQDSVGSSIKPYGGLSIVNNKQFDYFAKQSFIGFQTCAIIAQHWLVNKGVTIPAKDAIRKDYEITYNDGIDISIENKKLIRDLDVKYKIDKNLVEMVKFGRIFGIRIAIFKIDTTDDKFYEEPFNIDGVKPGSYRGISQIDPYWCTPILTSSGVSDPSDMDFYEPTYWTINGKKYHKSHLIIMRTDEVADILKPSYFYAGISYPQKVMNRVYSAEKTANEAPLLAQTKRTNVYKTDLNKIKTDIKGFKENLLQQSLMQDNYGIRVVGKDDEVSSLDTSLADLDDVIMTQYQIVAGELNVPVNKLMGTSLKGFSSGDGEQDSYIEELENIQKYDMNPLLNRHYQLLIKSELNQDYKFDIVWNSLKILSEVEKATIREADSRTDMNYINSRVLAPETVTEKLVEDKNSRYHGIEIEYEEEDLINEEDQTNQI